MRVRVSVDFYGRELLGETFPLPEDAEEGLAAAFSAILHAQFPVLGGAVAEVSVNLVSPEEMEELNSTYRKVAGPTDVLSFPLWEEDGAFSPPSEWKELPLGDIVVCDEVVARNAQERGVPAVRELALVLVHGFLHLLGWDHETPEKETAMWREQDRYVLFLLERWRQRPPTQEEVEEQRER